MQKKTVKTDEVKTGRCDSCEFYDYDEFYQSYSCSQQLDEDETVRFLSGYNPGCPYFKFYDEYKSVQKQN